jgi:hypothetical protein
VTNRVEIEGGAELHRALNGLAGDLRDLSPLNGQIANDLARAVSAAAPRASGALAASFEGKGTREAAEVSSGLDYAGPQNYGVPAHNIEGSHYAENALAASEGAAAARYRAGIESLLRKAQA